MLTLFGHPVISPCLNLNCYPKNHASCSHIIHSSFIWTYRITKMPPRIPPKSLMITCTNVISHVFLDIIVKIEDTLSQELNPDYNKDSGIHETKASEDNTKVTLLWNCEAEIAKYLFSSLPSTLISLLVSEIITEFASRWKCLIKATENENHIGNIYRSRYNYF